MIWCSKGCLSSACLRCQKHKGQPCIKVLVQHLFLFLSLIFFFSMLHLLPTASFYTFFYLFWWMIEIFSYICSCQMNLTVLVLHWPLFSLAFLKKQNKQKQKQNNSCTRYFTIFPLLSFPILSWRALQIVSVYNWGISVFV